MTDKVFTKFLTQQHTEGRALAEQSEILTLHTEPSTLPQRYYAEYRCNGLVQDRDGRISPCGLFIVSITFPNDYLRRAEMPEVLTWVGPVNAFHPNILGPRGWICIGRLEPGTGLVDILYQLFEIITYHNYNPSEHFSLNRFACSWARNNQGRFPTDSRPLKRPASAHVVGQASRLPARSAALGPSNTGETPGAAGGTAAPLPNTFKRPTHLPNGRGDKQEGRS
jgi:hypothetical protein